MAISELLHLSNPSVAITTLLATLVLYFSYTLASCFYLSPLSRFPGPKSWAYSVLPFQISNIQGHPHLKIKQLFQKYGSPVRIGPNELAFSTPQAFRDIHGVRPGHTYFGKDPFFYRNPLGADHLVSTRDLDAHARQRRLLVRAFSEKAVRDQEGMLKMHVDKFIRGIRETCEKETKVDVGKWLNFTTFDITGDILFGESFHCLDKGELHPIISFIFDSIKLTVIGSAVGRIPGMNRLLSLVVPASMMKQAQEHYAAVGDMVAKRLEKGETERADLISLLLKDGLTEKGGGISGGEDAISRAELHANAYILVMAGSETSASLLTAAVYFILTTPNVQDRLRSEIRSAFSTSDSISPAAANSLPYVNAVIQESLRMYPPAAIGLNRVVPEGGDTVDGHWVPGGTIVSCHQYAAYHSRSNFGAPDEFHPERWLDEENADSKGFRGDKKDALNPFSLGPHGCLGISLAWAEMRVILCKLFWHFDLELCDGQANWTDQKVFLVWDRPPLMVKCAAYRN